MYLKSLLWVSMTENFKSDFPGCKWLIILYKILYHKIRSFSDNSYDIGHTGAKHAPVPMVDLQ